MPRGSGRSPPVTVAHTASSYGSCRSATSRAPDQRQ